LDYENRAPVSYTELLSHVPPVIDSVTPISDELYKYRLLDKNTGDFSVCAEFEDSTQFDGGDYEAGQYCIESTKPSVLLQKGVNGGVDIEHAISLWSSEFTLKNSTN
jgi:hypothetical protein